MISTLTSTPAIGLSAFVAADRSAHTGPDSFLHGTRVPGAGTSVVTVHATVPTVVPTAQVAFGARVRSLPGPAPRGAPV